MTVPLRITNVNLIDLGTVTASSFISNLTPDRMQVDDIQSVWRAGATSAWILADLLAPLEVSAVALINSNALEQDAAQVRLSTTDATGAAGDAYDSGSIAAAVDPRYRRFVHFIQPAAVGRYLRIDLAQASLPEAGRWVAGATWAPSRNFQYGWQPLSRDWSTVAYSLGQNVFFDRQQRQRGLQFSLAGLTEAEAETEVEALNRLAGASRDVLVCRDLAAPNLGPVTLWGVMEAPIATQQTHHQQYRCEFALWDRL